jgi:hypothetical protein
MRPAGRTPHGKVKSPERDDEMSGRDDRAPSTGTAPDWFTEGQNGSARERITAVHKSWTPPTSLSGWCSRRRPMKAHEIPSRAPGFYQPGRRGFSHAEPRRPRLSGAGGELAGESTGRPIERASVHRGSACVGSARGRGRAQCRAPRPSHRAQRLETLARIVDQGRTEGETGTGPSPLTAEGVVTRPQVREIVEPLLLAGQIATCGIVDLELLFSA